MTRPQEEARASRGPDPDVIRTEAERLVAAGLAAVSVAADRIGAPTRERGGAAAASFDALGDMLFGPAGHRRHSIANDSPECCKCPVCRMIAAARQPSPGFAERLATGVGFVAEGAARVMRGVAGVATVTRPAPTQAPQPAPAPAPPPAPTPPPSPTGPDPWADLDPWAAATAAATTEPAAASTAEPATADPEAPGPAVVASPPPAKRMAKKAVKQATTKKATTKKATTKSTVKKAAVKKAAAKKAARPKKSTGNSEQ